MRAMDRFWLLQMVALIALVGGCASEQQKARNALPQTYPATISKWNNGLNHVEFVQPFQLNDYAKVVVLPVDSSGTKLPPSDENTYKPVTVILSKSADLFVEGIRGKVKALIPVEASTPAAGEAGKWLKVQIRILEMDPGSQAMRYWVGMGAGRAHTRIEGDLIDAQTNQALLHFQDDDYGSAGLFGGGYEALLTNEVQTIGENFGVLLIAFTPAEKK